MKRKKKKQGRNTKIGVYFFAFILGVIITSFILKGFTIVKNSRFRSDSRFNFLITNNKESSIISSLPQNHSVSVLKIEGNIENINRFAEVPLDGEVRYSLLDLKKPPPTLISDIFFALSDIKTNFTPLDLFRIFLFTKTANPGNFTVRSVSVNLDEAERDKISSLLFADPKISDERLSIEVVNATDEFGVGNRLARLITNISGNVILVSTSQKKEDKSLILYKGKKSYTLERLGKFLGLSVSEIKDQTLADITIRIGKDYKNLSNF